MEKSETRVPKMLEFLVGLQVGRQGMEAKEEFYQELEEIGENDMEADQDQDQDQDMGENYRVTDENALNEDAMQNIILDD